MSTTQLDKQLRAARFERVRDAIVRGPKQAVRWAFASTPALSNLYWAFIDGAFGREHRAVIAGMRAYEAIEGEGTANRFLLRRNTHRLEKGLIMRPRRGIFALDYIEATVDAYARALEDHLRGGVPREDIQWAHDVLAEYFSVVDAHPVVDNLRDRFTSLPPFDRAELDAIPYRRDLDGTPPVDFDDLAKLAKRRRSVRWFDGRPVPRDLIDQALKVAFEAPSACNRQPFVFRFYDEPEKVRALMELPMGTRGFAHNVPVACAIVGQLRAYPSPRDRHLIYIDGALAAMGFMLALETLGLSSCPINWPDVASREAAIAKSLDLAPDQRVVMLMAVGYPDPDGMVPFSQKQPLDSLRSFNE